MTQTFALPRRRAFHIENLKALSTDQGTLIMDHVGQLVGELSVCCVRIFSIDVSEPQISSKP